MLVSDPHRRRDGARARALGGGQGKVAPLALAATRGAPTPCRAAREPGHATRGPVLPSSCLGRAAWGPRLLPAASSTLAASSTVRLLHPRHRWSSPTPTRCAAAEASPPPAGCTIGGKEVVRKKERKRRGWWSHMSASTSLRIQQSACRVSLWV
jgi:hypothetical protein